MRPSDSAVALRTYIKNEDSDKKERPPSRGSQHALSVLDFDWYGNTNDIRHLTVAGPDKTENLNFVTSLRNYPSNTSFKAARPWNISNETPLKDEALASHKQLDDLGFSQNKFYSSVSRIDPK